MFRIVEIQGKNHAGKTNDIVKSLLYDMTRPGMPVDLGNILFITLEETVTNILERLEEFKVRRGPIPALTVKHVVVDNFEMLVDNITKLLENATVKYHTLMLDDNGLYDHPLIVETFKGLFINYYFTTSLSHESDVTRTKIIDISSDIHDNLITGYKECLDTGTPTSISDLEWVSVYTE